MHSQGCQIVSYQKYETEMSILIWGYACAPRWFPSLSLEGEANRVEGEIDCTSHRCGEDTRSFSRLASRAAGAAVHIRIYAGEW